jgi:hypothetical protein
VPILQLKIDHLPRRRQAWGKNMGKADKKAVSAGRDKVFGKPFADQVRIIETGARP